MRVRAAAVGAVLLCGLSACGGEPAPLPSAPVTTPSCTPPAGAVDALPEGYRVVAGVVAVPADRILPVATSGQRDPAAELFAKWGLLVRAGETAEVSVESGPALIGWGSSVVPASSVRITACREGSQAWTAFAGGTWVTEPACVPLVIRAGDVAEEARMPIGVPCP
ncbi:hypothetical protein [Actinoplanes sp. NPDC051411]|uniref:hypothetical protein n=1 Tax=Actinoplanes sp. NPDC051411 TaxID=3155522 RepID=UPI0034436779